MTKAVIAIHGGAGAISRAQLSPEKERQYIAALSAIVETGQKMLNAGESALDVVTEAVRLLEECPLFNAGIGSVFTRDETHELDACVMDGYSLRAGAVAGVSRLRNPVLAARLVMERSPHVLLVGKGRRTSPLPKGWSRCRPSFSRRRSVTSSFLPPVPRGRPCWIMAVRRWMKRKNGHRRCGGAG
jgi:beta-aspartyl-peptidase (threonine type)